MRARLVPSSPPWLRRAALPLAAVPLALLAGCGSSHPSSGALKPEGTFDTAGPGPATTAPAPSAVPTAQLYKTVIDRYRAYQAAYKQAYATNDPSALPAVAMDPLLAQLTKDIESTKSKGEIWRFANTLNPRVYAQSKDGSKVYVIDCVHTLAGYRYSAKTGKRTGEVPGGSFIYRTTVQYDSGAWKVAATVRDRAC
ncbi:hypothetical protein F8568_010395 [Actinomadura sp. LD22]|uniref:Nuclear transport factor 2 family protein n=1 Tax=Actinomadura physcomitrii TaxID=2650748 RepID=A0A6I4M716_9ACTN|nr:hypothetical protein [Actinomadura physcomitrii]MWA00780.1 hypothetical protein [Actinomadura physcomitrii]